MSFQFKFEELIVYQEALTFIDKVYIITNTWPKDEFFGLTNQISDNSKKDY
jgi:hypothetical protein